ncbi:S1 family peptidase [Streptomyces gobiensis]|uniref:S1 family peptidase n=1 Tax=Streptomyces gobiensis TaxID=2875706 RepID=UPI001E4612C3|nr:trypsin-like serine protease [Streptomyces gobiensis]UGY94227.1 trypsin-like serine protease [Streptomyces gobiensis]
MAAALLLPFFFVSASNQAHETASDPDIELARAGGMAPQIYNGGTYADNRGLAAVLLDGDLQCSGAIVHDRWVLTAKHCIMYDTNNNGLPDTKYATSRIKVRVKSDRWDTGGGVVGLEFSKVRSRKDVAMLKLNRSANAETVRLASAHPKLSATTYLFGWGHDSNYYVKRGTEKVTSNSATDAYGGPAIQTSTIDGSPCFGDSGGPLFKLVDGNRYQVGILSTVSSGCTGTGYYASVPESKAWIQDVIARF